MYECSHMCTRICIYICIQRNVHADAYVFVHIVHMYMYMMHSVGVHFLSSVVYADKYGFIVFIARGFSCRERGLNASEMKDA